MINQNIEEIKNIISSRKKKTNCFSFYNEVLEWIESNRADAYVIEDNLFLFLKTHGFYKFYYYVNNFTDISFSKNLLESYRLKNSVSLEFTTKNNINLDEITSTVKNIGFVFYKEYARVISGASAFKSTKKEDEDEIVNYDLPTLQDSNELLEIMYKEFDVIADYLPTKEDLELLINNKSIVIKKLDDKIVFIQIYEYSRGALYSRMTWIDKKYRKPKYTIDFYKSLDEYLKQLNVENWEKLRSYGWIDKDNKNFKINLKFGAQLDGVTCTIFLYDEIKG